MALAPSVFPTLLLQLLLVAAADARSQTDEGPIFEAAFENWRDTDKNPCAWLEVTCEANSTVELALSGWGLRFNYDAFQVLSGLPSLHHLDLSNNNGFGIPDNIGNLTGLTHLDLSGCGLAGEIPEHVSRCQSLRYIFLENSNLTGEIPSLDGLMNLQILDLANNSLTGAIPRDLGLLDSLIVIDLSNNSLNGTIPSLSGLTNLLELRLDNNNFTNLSAFPGTKSLKHLSIQGNRLEGRIPPDITTMGNLQFLDLSNNQLSGEIPVSFSHQNISALDLSRNNLTGSIPPELLQFPAAYTNLSHNSLADNISILGSYEHFTYMILDLSYNNLIGNIVDSLINRIKKTSPDTYYMGIFLLQNNSFTGDLARLTWTRNSSIDILNISNNKLHWSANDAISDPLRVALETCPLQMVEFSAGGNNLSGIALPMVLQNSCQLEVLDLSNTHLTGTMSGAVFNSIWFPNLHILNLSNNDITGGIPESILMLPYLVQLNVSNNKLSGCMRLIQPTSALYTSFFIGNDGLHSCTSQKSVQWWLLMIIVGGSLTRAMASCLIVIWRWRVYHKLHQQDVDLIKTLLEGESATLISLRELKKPTNNFSQDVQIGEGGFGTVYKGQLNDGTIMAIKRSKCQQFAKGKEQFLNEVRILSQVNHRNLVKLFGCCMENKNAVLVFEFISNGTLQEHLHTILGKAHLSWQQRLKIATQTADALTYLHSGVMFPIYHRDVKSANILLDDKFNVKVADFGISKFVPMEATHVSTAIQGTMGYIDPEYYTSFQLTDKSDVYSFGVILLELISAKHVIDYDRIEEEASLVIFPFHISRADIYNI